MIDTYTIIRCLKLADTTGEFTVVRQYEDFEWLHHCIVTKSDIAGLIVSSREMFACDTRREIFCTPATCHYKKFNFVNYSR